jgi:hypothetical protein
LRRNLHNSAALGSEGVQREVIIFLLFDRASKSIARSEKEKLMIGKATVFAIVMLAPGFAFAADTGTAGAAPAVTAHDSATTVTTGKSDVKSDVKANPDSTVKTAKAKGHKTKAAVPAAEKKTDTKS